MNKQYRPLEVGEYLQLGDELRCIDESINPGRKWYKVKASEFGYQIEKDSAHDFRRPISLSTDTEAIASKMAVLADAVADAKDEWPEDYKGDTITIRRPERSKSTEPQEPLTFEQMMKRMEAAKNRVSNPEHRFGFECAMAVIEAIVPEIEE